jgi:hypothetical protein
MSLREERLAVNRKQVGQRYYGADHFFMGKKDFSRAFSPITSTPAGFRRL